MRIYDGTAYRDATPEEIADWEASRPQEPPAPTLEERVDELEQALEKGMSL